MLARSLTVLAVAVISTSTSVVAQFPCFPTNGQGSLETFVSCVAGLYIRQNEITTEAAYLAKLPPAGLTTLAANMLVNGCSATIPTDLAPGAVQLRTLVDTDAGRTFCIATDTQLTPDNTRLEKAWGVFVVPVGTDEPTGAGLHIQAPHPLFDANTDLLATHLFRNVRGFRSLLLATLHRHAYRVNSGCLTGYSKTDPTHNADAPFHAIHSAIAAFEAARTCPTTSPARCGVVQIHGKGSDADSCPTVTVFGSAGLANSGAYTTHGDRWLVTRIAQRISAAAPADWVVATPETSTCGLTATKNVQGRVMNNVPTANVCTQGTTISTTTGRFAHFEIAPNGRAVSDTVFSVWRTAFNAFLNP
ncbi:hypothetical protein HDU96_008951 [Phlyctochytrium bullatum]|nr:hypothetical protein HDU96_008951 [Phlyctochytrium bullatum]